ncbi:MAG: hypothetical protein AAB636_01425 [Patescibacteria group bacterium]
MRKINLILILILSLISVFTLSPFYTFAQVQDTDVTLSISPEYPSAKENVTASLSSYVIDLNKANISWSLNNEEIGRGIGKKTISFTINDLGLETILNVNIETTNRQSIDKTIIIPSGNIDMLWEATDSYVPPFYRGKALVAREGKFKIVAIPSIISQSGQINPNNLSYAWKKDNNGQTNSSGWGKSSFSFKNSYLDIINKIEVTVSDISGNTKLAGSINLQTTQPKILFYKKDPLLGVQNQNALNNDFTVGTNGETIIAIPYFFSPKNLSSSNLTWNWEVGNSKINTPTPKNEIRVKGEEGKGGRTKIKIVVSNIKTLFQEAVKEIIVSF